MEKVEQPGSSTIVVNCMIDGCVSVSIRGPLIRHWVEKIKRIPGRRYDPSSKRWLIPCTEDAIVKFCNLFKDTPVEVEHPELYRRFPAIGKLRNPEEFVSLDRLVELIRRKGYSRNTERAYLGHANRFLDQLRVRWRDLKPEHVRAYVRGLLEEGKSHIYVSQAISALRFWIGEVEKRAGFQQIWAFPKREKKLPTVLSMGEVRRLLESIPNLKHRAILALVYASGLRVGEAVRLRHSDVDPERKMLHIRQSKGKKDRYTVLSDTGFRLLLSYLRSADIGVYLFPSGDGLDKPITVRSVQS